jgi:hypothetical protein
MNEVKSNKAWRIECETLRTEREGLHDAMQQNYAMVCKLTAERYEWKKLAENENENVKELTADCDELKAKLTALEKQDRHIRRLMCASLANRPYMDDGEASDSETTPFIDYLRDASEVIETKLRERNLKEVASAPSEREADHAAMWLALDALQDRSGSSDMAKKQTAAINALVARLERE